MGADEAEPNSSSSSDSENSSSPQEEEEEEEEDEIGAGAKVSDYEQQRLSRIRENTTRLQALGLPHLASSLIQAKASKSQKGKTKKRDEDDEEYQPSEEDDRGQHGEDEEEEDDEAGTSASSRGKGKKKSSSIAKRGKKSSKLERKHKHLDEIDDDEALQMAIALSLGETAAGPSTTRTEGGASVQETSGRKKSRKMYKSRVQLTENEVVAYFYSFDEAGKGNISLRDLLRMVLAHDFSWTETEIASMIHFFDTNRDGKLSLEDFRAIVSQCNMLQETGSG